MSEQMSRKEFLQAAGGAALGLGAIGGIPLPSPVPSLPGQLILWVGEVQDGYPTLNGRQDTRWRVADNVHLLVYEG